MERIAVSLVLGYVLGSIPTAYLVVRWKSQLDIREHGSGNVGTLNSYEVSGSAGVGLLVLVLDLLKGVGVAVLSPALLGATLPYSAIAGVAAVIGHNYPVWLGFRGGRGLAPAAGVAIVVYWGLVPFWLALWAAGYAVLRRVNPASAVACCVVCIVVIVAPGLLPGGEGFSPTLRTLFTTALMGVILLRLAEPVLTYVSERKNRRNSQ